MARSTVFGTWESFARWCESSVALGASWLEIKHALKSSREQCRGYHAELCRWFEEQSEYLTVASGYIKACAYLFEDSGDGAIARALLTYAGRAAGPPTELRHLREQVTETIYYILGDKNVSNYERFFWECPAPPHAEVVLGAFAIELGDDVLFAAARSLRWRLAGLTLIGRSKTAVAQLSTPMGTAIVEQALADRCDHRVRRCGIHLSGLSAALQRDTLSALLRGAGADDADGREGVQCALSVVNQENRPHFIAVTAAALREWRLDERGRVDAQALSLLDTVSGFTLAASPEIALELLEIAAFSGPNLPVVRLRALGLLLDCAENVAAVAARALESGSGQALRNVLKVHLEKKESKFAGEVVKLFVKEYANVAKRRYVREVLESARSSVVVQLVNAGAPYDQDFIAIAARHRSSQTLVRKLVELVSSSDRAETAAKLLVDWSVDEPGVARSALFIYATEPAGRFRLRQLFARLGPEKVTTFCPILGRLCDPVNEEGVRALVELARTFPRTLIEAEADQALRSGSRQPRYRAALTEIFEPVATFAAH